MLAAIFYWNEISRMFWVFWQLLVQLTPLITFMSKILQRVKNLYFSPRSRWQVASETTKEIADFYIEKQSSESFLVLTPWYYPFLDRQTTELLRYIFWWSSQTKDPKICRGRHEIYWKKQPPLFLLGQFFSVFFSFLGTTSPI